MPPPSRCSCAPSEPSTQPDRVGSAPTLPQRGPHRACSYDAADSKLFANRPGEHGEIRATAMALQVCRKRRGVAGDPMVPCDGWSTLIMIIRADPQIRTLA